MKKLVSLAVSTFCLLIIGCSNEEDSLNKLQSEIDSLTNTVSQQASTISLQQDTILQLRDTISQLQFPANQRLSKIKKLIAEENFAEAKTEIANLQSVFPYSTEAAECPSLIQAINSKIAAIEAEKERIKALGFKALATQSKISIDYNTVTISGISIDKTFVHDVYETYTGSQWYYNTADRGDKFITAAMSVMSSSKNPNIPTLAFYNIQGDKLNLKGTFRIEMARWDDYGSYLGNVHDNNNDFSKVSTVKFKLGCELPEEDFTKPYIVVLKKENTQVRNYDRFRNPPIWYSGSAGYPNTLSIEDFNGGNYVAIRIANLK